MNKNLRILVEKILQYVGIRLEFTPNEELG
jgi:hypothetical protein